MLPAFLHPFAKPTRAEFVRLVRGEGAVVWDADGRPFIDAMASLWYCAIGHGRREMAEAIAAQVSTLEASSCFEPFTNDPADELAERLARLSPLPATRVFLTSGGSESVDTAMKLARLHHVLRGQPERTLIVSRQRGYHGVAYGGTSAQGIPPNREGFGPLVPEVLQVPADDIEAVAALLAQRGSEVAAILTEPVQGAGGVYPPPEGYLAGLRRLCDQHGALLIFDEVICGFGRLGRWFAAQRYQVEPDLITFAKGVTSGYVPCGGVLVGRRVREALEADPAFFLRHGFTYSGHPTAAAAGVRNLGIMEDERLVERADPLGRRLGDGLQALAADGLIAEARGDGAVWAAGFRPDQDAVVIRDRMLDLGVITRAIGTDTCTFCPPLVTTNEQIDQIVDALAKAAV